MKYLILALLLAIVGCDQDDPLYSIYKPEIYIPIDSNNNPEWALDIVQEAVDIWAIHNIDFKIVNEGSIRIRTPIPGTWIGLYTTVDDISYIYISDNTVYNIPCIVARDLGYYIGLSEDTNEFNTTPSLMDSKLYLADEECPWSFSDEIQICSKLDVCNER